MTRKEPPKSDDQPRRVVQPRREAEIEIKKGLLLMVKAPPYYTKEYLYQVTSAGDKMVRADLFHSPRVRKHWSREELSLLFEMGMVRVAASGDLDSAASESGDEGR